MSTSIDSLPAIPPNYQTPPHSQASNPMDANTNYNPNLDLPSAPPNEPQMDSETIHELVSGLQEATASGATSLPVRDIPRHSENQHDEQVQPNYVPPATNRRVRFEDEDEDYEETSNRQNKQKRKTQSIFDELQTPLLLAILFFLFQLPVVRLTMYKYLPALYDSAGSQLNLIGICLCSVAFGFGYTFIHKIMDYIASF